MIARVFNSSIRKKRNGLDFLYLILQLFLYIILQLLATVLSSLILDTVPSPPFLFCYLQEIPL